METRDYENIIAIAETGSFCRAAERLYVSQPTLSKSVAALERSLGVKLFDRSRVPVQLTQAGEIFLKYAQNVVAMENLMERELHTPQKRVLKIGVSGVLSRTILPSFLPSFLENHPNIMVSVVDGGYIDLENFACQEITDLTILSQPHFMSSALHYEVLSKQKLLLVVPAGHPWYRAENGSTPKPFPYHVSDLAKERFILSAAKNSTRQAIDQWIEDYHTSLNVVAEVNHYESSLLIAQRTKSMLTFIDEFYLYNIGMREQDLKRWPVNFFYFDNWEYRIQVYAIYRNRTAEIGEIIQFIKRENWEII